MTDTTEIKTRLVFRKSALEKLRAAYLALLDGGVKSYMIDDRQLTRFDIDKLKNEIDEMEQEVDQLTALLNGKGRRKSVGVVIRDW
jgi:DNA gyrase/topoisomerase IV subunit A